MIRIKCMSIELCILLGMLYIYFYVNQKLFIDNSVDLVTLAARKRVLGSLRKYHVTLLSRQRNFFIIEPEILRQLIHKRRWKELKWRFNLTEHPYNGKSLSLGVLSHQVGQKIVQLQILYNLKLKQVVYGSVPFETNIKRSLHYFLESPTGKYWHVVVFYPIKHFYWVGQVGESVRKKMRHFNIHFGLHEEIYDTFSLQQINSISYPDDIEHFLSEMSTSRYLHCPPGRRNWFTKYGISVSASKTKSSEEAIVAMKSMMRQQKLQFWIMCGTLLGWYRQCDVTPYTGDTDFATWSKYVTRRDLTNQFKEVSYENGLRLRKRFGEPSGTLEFSFYVNSLYMEKVDLFFIYPNQTHYKLPFHKVSTHQYAYSVYPQFTLCSVELLGYKLLAPCESEKIIKTEYGSNWSVPVKFYDYVNSPKNVDKITTFMANVEQEINFYYFPPLSICALILAGVLITVASVFWGWKWFQSKRTPNTNEVKLAERYYDNGQNDGEELVQLI